MVANCFRPGTVEELSRGIVGERQWRIVGAGRHDAWRCDKEIELPELEMVGIKRIIEFSPADQVVVVEAGMLVSELQAALAEKGQCLPYEQLFQGDDGTVGGAVALNLPHLREASHGTWRDWVIGLEAVMPNGQIARCGSKAVKNVAGYDVMRLFCGARGWLGPVVQLTLRTYPIASLPALESNGFALTDEPKAVQRVRRADFAEASAGVDQVDAPTATLVHQPFPVNAMVTRYPGDWVVYAGRRAKNVTIENPVIRQLMIKTKRAIDPDCKWNPGAFGEAMNGN